MTSVPRPRTTHARQSAPPTNADFNAKRLCLIVGLTCLGGFVIDMISIGLPFSPFNLQWRVGILQQLGDRSIILSFGSALLLYSQMGNRRLAKPLSLICLGVGVAFMLSCILVIRDGLILQDQAVSNISTQAQQLQEQIEQSKGSPELPENITPEQFKQAAAQVEGQAAQLKQNAQTGITKAGLASTGNLIVVGLGLIGLGRFGLVSVRRSAS